MSKTPITDQVTAVVVTYESDAEIVSRLENVLAQVGHCIVVDNGSNEKTLDALNRFKKWAGDRATLIENDRNVGLGKAQNQGIQAALETQAEWILLLDDDSDANPLMVENMLLSYAEDVIENDEKPIGIIAPRILQPSAGRPTYYVKSKWGIFYQKVTFLSDDDAQEDVSYDHKIDGVMMVIASGSMIHRNVFKKVGWMVEKFFIDYIDTEFCLRVVSSGWSIRVVKNATLTHRLGAKKQHDVLGSKVVTSNHNPSRRFTIYRNRVMMWKSYFHKTPSYVVYDIMASVYDVFRVILFEELKVEKIKQMMRGFFTGLCHDVTRW